MVVLLFLILAFMATVLPDPLKGYSYRFTSTKCSGSAMNTISNHFCFIKNYSRNMSTMNFGLTLTRDMDKFFLKYSVDYKYGAFFHPVMEPPALEWCSFYNGNSKNVLFNVVLDMVRDSVPGLIHKCPYKVDNAYQYIHMHINYHLFKIYIILECCECLQHDFKIETC